MYYVSRQKYWGVDIDDCNTVEIALGGLDYANPDMLVAKYSGEGQSYSDPREAVTVAITIAEQWKKDCPNLSINIASGYTGGNTMPFESSTIKELEEWAERVYKSLPKCYCGCLIEGGGYVVNDDPDTRYCSEYCSEMA